MKPIFFPESTVELKKPASMTDEECGSLHIHQANDGTCISCWTAPFWQRIKFLFHGKIWLGVLSGKTQPPVWLDCTETVFVKPEVKVVPPVKEQQECYKGHGPCDCPGLCRENC